MRNSGVVSLPSQRTLRDYTHFVESVPGFSAAVDQMLMEVSKVLSCEVCVVIETYYAWFRRMMYTQEFEKCVVLVMDEMHIREDLVYNKHSGELIGFMNLGDINSHLLRFERSLSDEDQQMEPLAKTMFTIMVRGLFTRLQFPYAQFPCTTISGDLIYDPFWEAVLRIERLVYTIIMYYIIF